MTAEIGQADVFISHAHEDKEVARPLAEALRQRGLTVWYDEYVLRLGDSLRQVIEHGLATARFGVVILSPSFFAKEWPQRELDALLARETTKRTKVLLPVWHNLTLAEVAQRTPVLAARLAVSTARGLEYVVEQIVQVVVTEKPPGASMPVSNVIVLPAAAARREEQRKDADGVLPGQPLVEPQTGLRFAWVPGGRFQMGDEEWIASQPVHWVKISPFWLGETPVTNAQYAVFLEQNGAAEPQYWRDRRFSSPDQPVVGVSWEEAQAFCRWLGETWGRAVLLPSEAQWEFAARGTEGRKYPWGDEPPDATRACFGLDWKKDQPAPVGSYPAGRGPFGTLDQAGNVWEWCRNAWDEKAYAKRAAAREEPSDPMIEGAEGSARVLRGGGWNFPAVSLRAAIRGRYLGGYRFGNVGFRVAVVP